MITIGNLHYFPFALAHLAFCAAAILAGPSALIFLRLGLLPSLFDFPRLSGAWVSVNRTLHGDHAKPAIDDQVKSGHREKA
jgi:hypothetical protein